MLWCVLAAFYLLFAGEVSRSEVLAGAPAAGAAACFTLLQARRERRLVLPLPRLRFIGRSLAGLVTDTARVGWRLLVAVWRRPAGQAGLIARQRFRPGDDNATDAGRRALVTLGLSIAPNGFAVGLAPGEDALLVHRLVAVPADADRDWPA